MATVGRCVLESDESGRVLDRLGMLEKVITSEARRQALESTGRVDGRKCKLPFDVILQVVLAMGIFTDLPIRQVFRHSRRLRAGETAPCRSSLCTARQRLGLEPLMRLFDLTVRPLAAPDLRSAFYRGLRWMGIDGTVMNVPDTAQNAAYFGRPSGERGDGAFPQVRKLSLVELGTHVEVAFKVGGYRTSEEALAAVLLKELKPGMLLLWDRNFLGFALWQAVRSTGAHLLARVPKGPLLTPIKHLSDGSSLAKIYPSKHDRKKDRNGVVVRVLKHMLEDPQRVGHHEEHRLMTDLLDEIEYPASELIPGYHERWEHELTYDEQKTHQDPPRVTKPTHLRSETPEGIVQELYALSLAHFVIRFFMVQTALSFQLDPDRLSFTGCLQTLRCRLPECDTRTPASFEKWYEALLCEMSQEVIPPRRNRVNPRVVRQKIRKWPRKQPEHRGRPPLTKTFEQTVVMLR